MYLLLLHILFVTLNCIVSERRTAVLMKETISDTAPIALSPSSYLALIRQSQVFVDKTLLIKEFLETENQTILVCRPKYWGKSVNMNMIKTFLQPRIDEHGAVIPIDASALNHRLFVLGETNTNNDDIHKYKPFLISHHRNIIDQYLGKYPVIQVDFSDVKGNTMISIIGSITKKISESFHQHKYMLEILDTKRRKENTVLGKVIVEKNYTLFKDFIDKASSLTLPDLRDSLRFLTEVLHQHYKTAVFILLDDYDVPMVSISSNSQKYNDDEDKFVRFYVTFLTTTFIHNFNLKKGFINGKFPLWKEALNTNLKKIHQDYLISSRLDEFYGFNEWETDTILERFNFTVITRRKIQSHYGGYRYHKFPEQFYNPLSLATFLAEKRYESWTPKGIDVKRTNNFLKNFLMLPEFEARFNIANSTNDPSFKLRTSAHYFTWREFNTLHKITMTAYDRSKFNHWISVYNKAEIADKAVLFLYLQGYLVFEWNTTSRNFYTGSLRFPNVEIADFMNSINHVQVKTEDSQDE